MNENQLKKEIVRLATKHNIRKYNDLMCKEDYQLLLAKVNAIIAQGTFVQNRFFFTPSFVLSAYALLMALLSTGYSKDFFTGAGLFYFFVGLVSALIIFLLIYLTKYFKKITPEMIFDLKLLEEYIKLYLELRKTN